MVGAVVSAFAMFGTVAVTTLLVILCSPRSYDGRHRLGFILDHLSTLAWAAVLLIGGAALSGSLLGSTRAASFFGHLWLTERPRRPFLSLSMWVAIAGVLWLTSRLSV